MTETQSNAPSLWAKRLGYAGLIPFVSLALAMWWVQPAHQPIAAFGLLSYGAVIASFLGAIHWGLVMREASAQSLRLLGWGVLPSLLAWLALFVGVASSAAAGLLAMAAVLGCCYGVDRVVYPRFQIQAWLPMRLVLTCIASGSCVVGAVAL